MFYQITFLLFKLKLIQPSESAIYFWTKVKHVEKLEYALKFGNYKTRKLAAEALEIVGKPSSIPVLINAINDKVQNVSIAVLNTLEKLGKSDELVKTIVTKRFNWVKQVRESNAKYEANKNTKFTVGNVPVKNLLIA